MNTVASQNNQKENKINHIIGFSAGKGGVGKSTITSLLANEFCRLGYQVGILDTNFTGASIAPFFGIHRPLISKHGIYSPFQSETGIKIMPVDKLVDPDSQVFIWKEEKAGHVISEVFSKTNWGELDYLLVDLPTATMEGAISIMQTLPFTGIICVTQPQAIAAHWMAKALQLIQHINIPVIGLVENMAYYQSTPADAPQYIWGSSHIDTLASNLDLPILARIPFHAENCLLCDDGKIEDIIMHECIQLYEAVTNSLRDIEKDNKTVSMINPISPELSAHRFIGLDETSSESTDTLSATVKQLIQQKKNMGSLESPDGEGYFMGKCGDRMQIEIQLTDNRISDARFKTDGCGVTIACGSMITQMAMEKSLQEARQLSAAELLTALDGLPDDHLHCADLAVMTLRESIIDAIEGHKPVKK